jgi:hypothetical protein
MNSKKIIIYHFFFLLVMYLVESVIQIQMFELYE